MEAKTNTIETFAGEIYAVLKSDRDVNVAVSGFTGEGKSTFATKLQKAYAKISGTYWGFDRMTWSRKELMRWIDGDIDKPKNEQNLRPGQLPEFSAILPDELFAMFYKRNWYNADQKDNISIFNMCRDRHLFVCGNIPSFWDIDSGFAKRIRYYVYIPERGLAWVFEQEVNPFNNDPWNQNENKNLFRKYGNPYKCKNYIGQIVFDDWDPQEKAKYYEIRNEKRLMANQENKGEKKTVYGEIKKQRDALIRYILETYPEVKIKKLAELTKLSQEGIRTIKQGLR